MRCRYRSFAPKQIKLLRGIILLFVCSDKIKFSVLYKLSKLDNKQVFGQAFSRKRKLHYPAYSVRSRAAPSSLSAESEILIHRALRKG